MLDSLKINDKEMFSYSYNYGCPSNYNNPYNYGCHYNNHHNPRVNIYGDNDIYYYSMRMLCNYIFVLLMLIIMKIFMH
jgi:hypothetical protein